MKFSTCICIAAWLFFLCLAGCGSDEANTVTTDAGMADSADSPADDVSLPEDEAVSPDTGSPDVGGTIDSGASISDPGSSGGDTPGAIGRVEDPVVLLGAQVSGLANVPAQDIVAFRREGGAWVQIPVQVDERAVQDFCEIYGKSSGLWTDSPACKTGKAITATFYTDASTFTGSDPDPSLDLDDEVVFMARDAGDRIGAWNAPPSVVAGSGVELELTDGSDKAYVYLFARDGDSLVPGAGAQYVAYDFVLKDGVSYTENYDLYGYNCGGNNSTCNPSMTENSTVEGATYSRHFSARWVTDELRITAGDATGVDILDIHQNRFGPGNCGRHVLTFSTAEGAYIVNKNGPVRGIRSYLGANSGPLTQRDHFFYDRREDIVTNLRVHALAVGIMDVFDYSTEAIGMTYYNDLNPGGLTIDGIPDTADETGLPQWEYVTGPQGSLVMTGLLDSSLELSFARFFWADEEDASFNQCATSTIIDAPDGAALGTSGVWLEGSLPNTAPKNGLRDHIMATRIIYYREPGITMDDVLALVVGAQSPVQVAARSVGEGGLGETCGDGTCGVDETASCALDCVPIDGSCGDGVCLPPEDSVACAADCPFDDDGVVECGDTTCDAGFENQLSCPKDCWPLYAGVLNCVDASCEGQLDACADEPECVELVACVGPCVATGGGAWQCISTCAATEMTPQPNLNTANALLACGNNANCF